MYTEAVRLIGDLSPHVTGATIIALSGDLGAGKTTFAQGIARALGVEEAVASPTFVIEKIYELTGQKWHRLIHIDAYRLEGEHELEVLGWSEVAQDRNNIIVIEWPEMVAKLISEDAMRIKITGDGDAREINLSF